MGKTNRHHTAEWWRCHVQLHIDNHAFKVPVTKVARRALAARRVRGCFRVKKKGLKKSHVRPNRSLRTNTGARNVLVAGGVGQGKMLLWHVIEGGWCGEEAVRLYSGPIRRCLMREYSRVCVQGPLPAYQGSCWPMALKVFHT